MECVYQLYLYVYLYTADILFMNIFQWVSIWISVVTLLVAITTAIRMKLISQNVSSLMIYI